MIPFGYYLIKLIACSAVLFAYYHMALRNKVFHHWNRFYLLSVVVLSLLLPCLQFTIWQPAHDPNRAIHLLGVVTGADEYVAEIGAAHPFLSTEQVIGGLYAAVCLLLLAMLLSSLVKIYALIRSHGAQYIQSIKLIMTRAKGTPFSFFQYIFWNPDIDMSTATGQQIFEHELVHVREKHSADKILLQIILVFFWCNPVFWLIRHELKMIHEFIADQKAVDQQDTAAFAAMLLQAAYPQHYQHITNSFFQKSIKRRLLMLTKIQNPRFNYVSRILALLLLIVLGFAFTLKTKTVSGTASLHFLKEPVTVVIDAGHGGNTGAIGDGIYEDEINLAIAKKIRELNTSDKINIVLSRTEDVNVPLKDRVQVAVENKASLFISLHVNAMPPVYQGSKAIDQDQKNGFEVYVPKDTVSYSNQSKVFGSILVQQLSSIYNINEHFIQRKNGVWVIDHNTCPSIIVECGYLTNKKDREFITKEENQTKIAANILSSVEQYLKATEQNSSSLANPVQGLHDTVPANKDMVKRDTATIFIAPVIRKDNDTSPIGPRTATVDNKKFNGIYVVDGKPYTGDLNDIDAGDIESMSVLKGVSAITKYGDKGKNDVIEITTKRKSGSVRDTIPKPNAATNEMKHDLSVKTMTYDDVEKNYKQFPVLIDNKKFIANWNKLPVDRTEVRLVAFMKGGDLVEQYGERAKDGVIFIQTKKYYEGTEKNSTSQTRPVFTQTEVEPQFPGGVEGWRNFLQTNLDPSTPVEHGAPEGAYTVIIQFKVDEIGKLSQLDTLTHHGYGMEAEVMKLMKASPNWEPAMQNGKKVTSIHKQPVTFVISSK